MLHDVRFDVMSGRGPDKEVGELDIAQGDDPAPWQSVPIEDPASDEQGRPLVAFSKRLGPGDASGKHPGRHQRIGDVSAAVAPEAGQPAGFGGKYHGHRMWLDAIDVTWWWSL